jgi:hypothetical protein
VQTEFLSIENETEQIWHCTALPSGSHICIGLFLGLIHRLSGRLPMIFTTFHEDEFSVPCGGAAMASELFTCSTNATDTHTLGRELGHRTEYLRQSYIGEMGLPRKTSSCKADHDLKIFFMLTNPHKVLMRRFTLQPEEK